MITREKIIKAEDNLITHCANRVTTSFGCLFYNEENKTSFDCNHALIYNYTDLPAAAEQIKAFYFGMAITPRIHSTGAEGESALPAFLQNAGWQICESAARRLLIFSGREPAPPPPAPLKIKRVSEIDADLYSCFVKNDNGGEWCAKAAAACLKQGSIDVFAGYENGKCVGSASIDHDEQTGLSLLQDVFVNEEYRNKGYAKAIVNHALSYQLEHYDENIYLWVENPIARKIYLAAGFTPAGFDMPAWEASFQLAEYPNP